MVPCFPMSLNFHFYGHIWNEDTFIFLNGKLSKALLLNVDMETICPRKLDLLTNFPIFQNKSFNKLNLNFKNDADMITKIKHILDKV
ncbi:hypothetical protein BpHYR1_020744 [Brachionus plicatilis]|uniref:Uncharacterized protein n=1 Tax=Brachionus plicatilis TaxID=10195 RepID=A0A3M7QCR3_BRAPC|nr:hypothetical protein BpHYR1_020744 [Brachionus plicatilis]